MAPDQLVREKSIPRLTPAYEILGLDTGETLRTLHGHSSGVNAVVVSPAGHRALSCSYDNTLRLWDLRDGKELVTLTVDGNVKACSLAPDNRTIVAGDGFGRVHFLRL